jgi:hypothetical protein
MSDLQPVVLQEIRIRQIMVEDRNSPVVEVLMDDDASLVQQLGLLEFAKDTVIRTARGEYDDS